MKTLIIVMVYDGGGYVCCKSVSEHLKKRNRSEKNFGTDTNWGKKE